MQVHVFASAHSTDYLQAISEKNTVIVRDVPRIELFYMICNVGENYF